MPPIEPESLPTLAELSSRVGGRLVGDGTLRIRGVCSFFEPESGCIAFLSTKSAGLIRQARIESKCAALLIDQKFAADLAPEGVPVVLVPNPQVALVTLIGTFFKKTPSTIGISPKAEIAQSARLGVNVAVGAFAVIGPDVQIGDGTVVHPHAVIYAGVKIGKLCVIHAGAIIREDTEIGNGVIIQPGVVLGADGFGYILNAQKQLELVPQVGRVVISDEVEVGANSCIDRAALGTTKIGRQTKIDNLVQVGHNTHIGQQSILCGQAGISGSVRIGSGVTIGGAAGIGDHVTIADGVRVGGKAGVTTNLTEPGDYAGHPVMPLGDWKRLAIALRKLVKKS